jgi:2,5-furandicarboxylate decarboxylase 1
VGDLEGDVGVVDVSDLRSMMQVLRERGLLLDIAKEVDPVGELGAVLRACERVGKAALFQRVKGHTIPVIGGVLGSHTNIALALGCRQEEIHGRLEASLRDPIGPERISGQAVAQEVIVREGVSLMSLPVPTHAPLDVGPFINAGVVIARDPETGRHNLSFNRMQVYGDTLAGLNMSAWRDIREFHRKALTQELNLQFCVAIGVDPAIMLAAAFRYDGDEYEIAGSIRQHPVPVVKAVTNDILVPASAEIVLEGEIIRGETHLEGPMAEFTGHYSGQAPQAVARIKAITHRKSPVFQTIAGASFEHLNLGNAVTREPLLASALRRISPRVRDVHLPPYGSGFTAIISMDNPDPGEPETVGIAALASHVNVKIVILVDADVDVYDPNDVMWALSTRVRWGDAPIIVPGALGNELDPSSNADGVQGKAIIVAVLGPERSERYTKVRYPVIDLATYLE